MLACLLAAVAFPAPFRFCVYGDDRDGHDVHRALATRMLAEKPALVFNTGDLVRAGSDASLWKTFDEVTGPLRKATDYFAVRGNHDVGTPGFEAKFAKPESDSKTAWFSFDRGGCHFIGLCVDGYALFGPGSDQYQWLVQDLAKDLAAHTFVFFHEGPYSIGPHGPNVAAKRTLCPLFEKAKVDVVFTGHDHIYYRTLRGGVTYLVTGGGGAELYAVDPKKGSIPGDKWESVHNYVSVTVQGSQVSLRALRADGTEIENFTPHRLPGLPGRP